MMFSVIVPVYNVERFLSKCLDSVLAQDYDDYEIVAVDDGSTDSSGRMLEEYKKRSSRVKVIHQENKGLGGARNTAIEAAVGDYLLFVDSDDYIAPRTLSTLARWLEEKKLDILAFDWTKVDEKGTHIQRVTRNEYPNPYTPLSRREFLLLEPTGCTKVYRRTLFMDHGIRFPERLWYEDLATVFRLAPFAEGIGYLKESFYHYVQQFGSITHSTDAKRIMEITTAFDMDLNFYRANGLFEEYRDELEWNCVLHVLYYSAFRLLGSDYHKREMEQLYDYAFRLFPDLLRNPHVLRLAPERDMMNLVLERKLLTFYGKTGFHGKCVRAIKKLIPWNRWRN